MLLLETRADLPHPRYSPVLMDARSVARAAGIKLNTFNAWISRGLIPWVTVGASGKRRDFDFDTAVRIAIFAELLRLSAPPDYAAQVAATMSESAIQAGWLYIIPAQSEGRITIAHFSPSEHASELIRRFEDDQDSASFSPASYSAISVARIVERVKNAEREWQESRGAKQPDG
jgi:hypothetical protein